MPRGFCCGFGSLLMCAATVLMILVNVGQIGTGRVERHLYLAHLNLTGLETTLQSADSSAAAEIFTSNATAPRSDGAGLRAQYYWGMYSTCASNDGTGSADRACTANQFGYTFEPLQTLDADAGPEVNLTAALNQALSGATISSDSQSADAGALTRVYNTAWLQRLSRATFYLFFVGTIVAGVAWLLSLLNGARIPLFLSSIAALGTAVLLGVGAAIWTAMVGIIKNELKSAHVSRGFQLAYGDALWLAWAAFACAVLAIIPLLVACCEPGRNWYGLRRNRYRSTPIHGDWDEEARHSSSLFKPRTGASDNMRRLSYERGGAYDNAYAHTTYPAAAPAATPASAPMQTTPPHAPEVGQIYVPARTNSGRSQQAGGYARYNTQDARDALRQSRRYDHYDRQDMRYDPRYDNNY